MNPNPRAILTGALLAAGTAGIQAVLTALGCGPAGIVASLAALLTTAITVLGPKLIDLRGQQQLSRQIRWMVRHQVAGADIVKLAALEREYLVEVLHAHVAAIEAARTEKKERKPRKARRPSTTAA
ncbi:MAG TPA: hypothetical protein VN969_35540 [Streptosporangiaceae bacterium]|jgi:hypothetical protein|nr:hypothetical protein [Streptosporangiaceae bacterium]